MTPELGHVCDIEADVGPIRDLGPTPHGRRRIVPILGGVVKGPRLKGEIVPGGADWQYVRSDGVTIAEAVYLLKAHDGTLIQIRNRGVRHGSAEVIQRLTAGEHVDPVEYYFRASPTFLVSPGPYDWLNKNVFVATGARYAREIELWFYRVT